MALERAARRRHTPVHQEVAVSCGGIKDEGRGAGLERCAEDRVRTTGAALPRAGAGRVELQGRGKAKL
ncbi:MAG: hypothetical protein ACK559_19995, partial [bacterium]